MTRGSAAGAGAGREGGGVRAGRPDAAAEDHGAPGAAVPYGRLPDARRTFDLVRRHFSPGLALTGNFAGRGAVEVGAEGCRVTLSDGRDVLDFGSYAVPLLGHRHPAVVAAVHRALDTLPTATRSLANPVTAQAATTLVRYFEDALPKVYFGLNGADAVEVAVKLARLASGRSRVLAVRGGFHGKSIGALALTHSPLFRAGLRGSVTDVAHADPEDAEAVRRAASRDGLAAIVFEPVQGENGVVPLPPAVLRRWCADARRHGAFVIADEIQCGLRRCGERSVALAEGLPVDAVLVGKPLGGGVVPLSAVVCSEELYAPLAADPFLHSATFGGHPLACAALPPALAAIEQRAAHGRELADAMSEGLARLRSRHAGAVREVRGRGLLWGVDYASPHLAGDVVLGLADAGLLVSPCLSRPTTVRLLPSLACGPPEVGEALAALDHATAEAAARCTEK
ncbi:aspartate aminotransferase family protein [Streptomyces sp. NPDC014983]|uniref:aspartate aminotransferase family protein n=1 Tax=Streptomyces sp. NPDC014983 TaxID=3364933 RepID=UPI0036FA25AA